MLDEIDVDAELEDGHDLESDPAECGIGDADGPAEQTHYTFTTAYDYIE